MFFVLSRAWDKEKMLSPHEESNQASDLWITSSNALPLSHRYSTVSEVNCEVKITCVLYTARISNVNSVMLVFNIGKMTRFWARLKKIEKDFLFVLHSWQDEKHISLFLYQAQNLPSFLIYVLLTFWYLWHGYLLEQEIICFYMRY